MEPSEELRDFALLYYQAIASGNIGFVERHISRQDGLLVIGDHECEWCAGYEAAIKWCATLIPQSTSSTVMISGDPQAYREGSVGWVADRPTIRLPDAREIPCRLTQVWHQENGHWKIVQHHLSIGFERQTGMARSRFPEVS
jgi:SnoaL-like domain